MDNRKSNKRSRSATINDDGYWDCSFCTYRNKSEAFKCEICNIRKGTSTRKPRITQVTQQFVKIENQIEQERKKERRKEILLKSRANKKNSLTSNNHNRFANAQTIAITVNDVTVFITDIELNIENENEFLNINNNNSTELSNSKNVANKKSNKMNNNLETSNQDLNNTDENTTSSNLDETDLNKNEDSNTSNNNNNHHNNSASNNLLLNNNKTETVRVDSRSN